MSDFGFSSSSSSSRSRYTIHVLAKALDLLEALGQDSSGLSLAQLGRRLRIPKSSLFRYLVTLEDQGYVERVPGTDQYRLGLKLFELGNLVAAQFDVREAALPHMRRLLETFQETVNLAILDGCEVVYLEILEGTRSIRMAARPGLRQYPHSTALGKAILAYSRPTEVESVLTRCGLPAFTPNTITSAEALQAELARVRERGYAVDDIENEPGVRCVGVPIFNHQGEVIAAISLSGPAERMSPSQIEAMGQELVISARAISQRLGYRNGSRQLVDHTRRQTE